MEIAPGSFSSPLYLPTAHVEKIKILPTNFTTRQQEFEITLSVCSYKGPKVLTSVPYMIFIGFCKSSRFIESIQKKRILAKDLIRNPKKKRKHIDKVYLPPDRTSRGIRKIKLSGTAVAYKKEITFRHSIPLSKLRDLYMYVTTYATDPNSLNKSGTGRKLKAIKMSNPVVEAILYRKRSSLTNLVFTLTEDLGKTGTAGQIWAGPVQHTPGGGYRAMPTSFTSPATPLLATKISNQKIQDLRFLNAVNRLPFNSALNKGARLSRRQTKNLATARKVMKPPGMVSDCQYSRTNSNVLKLFFSIDFARLVKRNTKFGRLIQNPNALAESFQIEDIRIYRTRVAPENMTPTGLTAGKIRIRGSSAKLPDSEEKLIATLKKGGVKPISFSGLNGGILGVVATDEDIAKFDVGSYEYSAIIDMVDMSQAAVDHVSNLLNRRLTRYNRFLSASTRAGKPGLNTRSYLKNNRSRIKGRQKEWKKLIGAYVAAVEFMFGSGVFGPSGRDMWTKNLIAMTNPANGDIVTMKQVGEIVEKFVANLRQVTVASTTPTSANKFNIRSKVNSQNSTRRKVALKHTFKSNYDQKGSSKDGTDYLDSSKVINNGKNLTNIDFKQYSLRMQEEFVKYKVPRPNTPGINKFGFISPKRLSSRGSSVDTSLLMLPQSDGNGFLKAALNANTKTPQLIPSNVKNHKVYDDEVENILGDSDVMVVPNTQRLTELLKGPRVVYNRTNSATSYLSVTSQFAKENNYEKASVSGSQTLALKRAKAKKSQIKKSKLVNFVISAKSIGFKRATQVEINFPVGGSLAAAAAAQRPYDVQSNSGFGNSVNFNSLAQVQYFDGYLSTNGTVNLNAPRWRQLTQEKFNEFKTRNSPVLCRLMVLGKAMKMKNRYKLPTYNNIFILGNTSARPSSINYGRTRYGQLFSTLYKNVIVSMKKVALNVETPLSSIDPLYTSTPIAFVLGSPINSSRAAGRTPRAVPAPRRTRSAPRTRTRGRSSGGRGGGY